MGFTKKKTVKVGVAVTISNKMEAVVVDVDNKTVTEYRTMPLEYNFQNKEIADYNAFANALKTMLFDEMGLNPKNIDLTLTIPSIHFATAQVPAGVEGSSLESVCATFAQDSYLFKRHEPVIAAQTYPAQGKEEVTAIYSAIQEGVADQLREALISVGIENFSVNNPYGSIINALDYLGLIEKEVNSNERWNFVQITDIGFTLFSMSGTRIIEINDMPLPLKTFSPDEIYESMALSLQNNLSIYPASYLFVLSRTDLLSAQMLLQRMELRGEVKFLENNKFNFEPVIATTENVDIDLAKIISVEAIGSAVTDKNSPLNLCYMTNKDLEDEVFGYFPFMGKEIPVNDAFINNAIFALMGVIVGIAALFYFCIGGINKKIESDVNKYQSEKAGIQKKIDEAKGATEGSVDNIIADISKNNKSSVTYFSSIATEIPQSIWLTYFYSDTTGALAIKGDTADVESIYQFFKGIKAAVPGSSISLSKLEYNDIDALLSSGEQSNKSLNFEITNSAYSDSKKMMASEVGDKENNSNNSNNSNTNNNSKAPANNNPSDSSSGNSSSDDDEFDESGFPPVPKSGLKPPTN